MPTPPQLLTPKLAAPLSRPDLAPRPRLVERLIEGLAGQLTLLSAPAGAGKTTLLNAWRASESGRRAHLAWLLLDDDDNDAVRFLTYLGAALDAFGSGIGAAALSLLQSPQPPEPKLVMTALINALGELPLAGEHDFYVLVLDDYHVITAQPIHDTLAQFLAHLPAHVRLVISTRADPPFPLARLRARQQLTEIRAADLAFTPEEVAIFLNRVMHLALSPEQVAALTQRTEGWIAGLQLAALSLRGRDEQSKAQFISGFTGNNEYIVDLLMEEVLALVHFQLLSRDRHSRKRHRFLLTDSSSKAFVGTAMSGRTHTGQYFIHIDNWFTDGEYLCIEYTHGAILTGVYTAGIKAKIKQGTSRYCITYHMRGGKFDWAHEYIQGTTFLTHLLMPLALKRLKRLVEKQLSRTTSADT